ncbi:hypothetical protein IAU60_002475 [Kwoniella sp. DSM 27419]
MPRVSTSMGSMLAPALAGTSGIRRLTLSPIAPLISCVACPCSRRALSTRRFTSFWTQSYPHTETSQVPYIPPAPSNVPMLPGPHSDGKRDTKQKQRYLDSLMDKAGELSLRCSILDSEGEWRAEEGRYKKTELCREHDLDPRDLRKLDSLAPNVVPIILTRKSCILISMLNIRALIKPDRVIVFDTAGTQESEASRRFKYHLERNIRAGLGVDRGVEGGEEELLSYEHRALESILVATANALEEEMAFTRQLVQQLLADLEDDINRDNLKRLLHYSRRIVGFQSRARYVKRAADEILESDEDLSAMYLTSRAQGRPRALHDHEQLELLLESFVKQVEEIVSEVDTTVANMNSTQEIAELMLDSGRNALLALDIKVSIATLGIGTGALIAGFFGMNLTTQMEDSPYAFLAVTGSASMLALLVVLYSNRTLRRVRRVALSGKGPSTLSRVMTSKRWDSSVAQFSQGFDPALVDKKAEMAKRAIWDKLFWRRMRSSPPSGDIGGKRMSGAQHKDRLATSNGRTGSWSAADLKALGDRWRAVEEERNRLIHARMERQAVHVVGGEQEGGAAALEHGVWKWGKGYGQGRRWAKE